MKAAAPNQLAMEVDDPEELAKARERSADDQRELLQRFFKACREVCRELTYEKVANELEYVWGEVGRHVSSGVLKQTIAAGSTGNYFRWEWGMWFAQHNDECADVFATIIGRGRPQKSPEVELRDLQDTIREEYPRQAVRLIRKGQTR